MASRTNESDVSAGLAGSLLNRMKMAADAGDRLWVGLGRGVASLGPSTPPPGAPALLPACDPMVSSRGLGLLSAPSSGPGGAAEEGHAGDMTAGNDAGVQPVLRALGQIVSEHANNDYRSLNRDRRFWALIELIESLRPSEVTGAGSESSNHPSHPDDDAGRDREEEK